MLELVMTLDFACCVCEHSINVTVKCAGKGLKAGARTVASCNVPCPTCNSVNQLLFEPSGTIRAVMPYRGPVRSLEPSVN